MEGNKRRSSGDEIGQALVQEHKRLKEEQESLKSELTRQKNPRPATEIEWRGADSTSQKKTLKKFVEKLISHDKIVQIHFDDVPTNGTTVYNRAENRLLECGYSDSSASKAEPHQTVVVFGVQSLLTAFNMLLSCYPLTSNTEGMEKSSLIYEEIFRKHFKTFTITALQSRNKRKSSGDEINPGLIKKCQDLDEEQEELKSELARQKSPRPATEIEWRGADSTSQKKTLKKVMEKLTSHDKIVQLHFDEVPTDRTTVYSRAEDRLIGCGYSDSSALKTERHQTVVVFGVQSLLTAFNMLLSCYPLTSNTEGMEKRLEDNLKLAEEIGLVVKAVERMVEQNIGKRIQATVVSRLDFFRAAGSCNNGSSHRINLFGYILFMLLTGKNFTDPRGPNIHYLIQKMHNAQQQHVYINI
uniref:Transposable element P transposase-like RNase H domain-containing protein n=1 Tax=Glossina palpalis gambiensis TaxID=67801 RepID=A0A1B0BST9_9MUSC